MDQIQYSALSLLQVVAEAQITLPKAGEVRQMAALAVAEQGVIQLRLEMETHLQLLHRKEAMGVQEVLQMLQMLAAAAEAAHLQQVEMEQEPHLRRLLQEGMAVQEPRPQFLAHRLLTPEVEVVQLHFLQDQLEDKQEVAVVVEEL